MSDGKVPIFRLRVSSESEGLRGSAPLPPQDSEEIRRRKALYRDRFHPTPAVTKSGLVSLVSDDPRLLLRSPAGVGVGVMAVIAVVLGIFFPTVFIACIVVVAIAVTIALIIKQGLIIRRP